RVPEKTDGLQTASRRPAPRYPRPAIRRKFSRAALKSRVEKAGPCYHLRFSLYLRGKDGPQEAQVRGEERPRGQEKSQEGPEDAEARFGGEVARRQEAAARQAARTGAQGGCAEGGARGKGARPETRRQERQGKNADQERQAGARAAGSKGQRGQGEGQGRPWRPPRPQG